MAELGRAVAPPPLAAQVAMHAEALRLRLAANGEQWIRATGGSMWPTIRDGDEVLVTAPIGDPRIGQVVLVEASARLVLHRVARAAGRLTTIGDASEQEDGPLRPGAIVATAIAARREGRTIALAPTLRFGPAAVARWAAYAIRLSLARAWRALRGRRARVSGAHA